MVSRNNFTWISISLRLGTFVLPMSRKCRHCLCSNCLSLKIIKKWKFLVLIFILGLLFQYELEIFSKVFHSTFRRPKKFDCDDRYAHSSLFAWWRAHLLRDRSFKILSNSKIQKYWKNLREGSDFIWWRDKHTSALTFIRNRTKKRIERIWNRL